MKEDAGKDISCDTKSAAWFIMVLCYADALRKNRYEEDEIRG